MLPISLDYFEKKKKKYETWILQHWGPYPNPN